MSLSRHAQTHFTLMPIPHTTSIHAPSSASAIASAATSSTRMIATRSFAKINLGLEVLHKRADSFHALNTIFLRVSLADSLVVAARPQAASSAASIELHCEPALDVSNEDNLAYKAANMICQALYGSDGDSQTHSQTHSQTYSLALALSLLKRIPTGGGLGGGSSNAASALMACAELLRDHPRAVMPTSARISASISARTSASASAQTELLELSELLRLAARLGSDVPFFVLRTAAALGTGRGEVLTPLSVRLPYWILLVCSGVHVSTPWAYRALGRGTETSHSTRPATDYAALLPHIVAAPEQFAAAFVNDFEPAVFAEHPLLERIKSRLYDAGAFFALMSGSGSTMFGLFTSREAAEQAQSAFEDLRVEYRTEQFQTFLCQNL
jgi:4-diphosphocytidyl-2-C-methyl-D-erythritol kinase